jgi:hypothetical protein
VEKWVKIENSKGRINKARKSGRELGQPRDLRNLGKGKAGRMFGWLRNGLEGAVGNWNFEEEVYLILVEINEKIFQNYKNI